MPIVLTKLLSAAGGLTSLGGMALSLVSRSRFSDRGLIAVGIGATGTLLSVAAVANPAALVAPILASSGIAAGVASITLAHKAATYAGSRLYRRVSRYLDLPPAYSTLQKADALELPPPYSTLQGPPPPYSPPLPGGLVPTHTATLGRTQRHATHRNASLPTKPVTTRMGVLPSVQYINEVATTSTKIRTSTF